MEGMQAFGRRHFAALPHGSTEFVCLECVGSPQLCVVEGEGMLRMRDYTESSREELARDLVRVVDRQARVATGEWSDRASLAQSGVELVGKT